MYTNHGSDESFVGVCGVWRVCCRIAREKKDLHRWSKIADVQQDILWLPLSGGKVLGVWSFGGGEIFRVRRCFWDGPSKISPLLSGGLVNVWFECPPLSCGGFSHFFKLTLTFRSYTQRLCIQYEAQCTSFSCRATVTLLLEDWGRCYIW